MCNWINQTIILIISQTSGSTFFKLQQILYSCHTIIICLIGHKDYQDPQQKGGKAYQGSSKKPPSKTVHHQQSWKVQHEKYWKTKYFWCHYWQEIWMHPRVPMTATHHQSSLGWKVEVWSETSSYQRLNGFFSLFIYD